MDQGLLDILISNQRKDIRWLLATGVGIVLLGIGLLVSMALWGHRVAEEPLKTILTIAAGFVGTVAGFPLNELRNCAKRVNVYLRLREVLEAGQPDEIERIEEMVWEAVKKVAVG